MAQNQQDALSQLVTFGFGTRQNALAKMVEFQFAKTHKIMTTRTVPATLFTQLKSKVEARQALVAVIGLGYVGLPLTLLYTEQKFPVTGFDID